MKRIILHPDDPKCRTSWPDPGEDLTELCWTAVYAPARLQRRDVLELVAVAHAYKQPLTHPAGTENAMRCLRDLRRAVKEQS